MRTTRYLLSTLKETPAEASIASHRLMLRAGLMRQLAAGIYTLLPTGHRVYRKVERIIREEHEQAGCLELMLPVVQPAELWQESGRYEQYGPELCRLSDRRHNAFVLGPTHEEVITAIARHEIKSPRQLPLSFYQIQIKFRDEMRPRFGIMRGREFVMCDTYSFHADRASLQQTYQAMYDLYGRIFTRLGLTWKAVHADTGAIGGSSSHEFQVLAEAGEDIIAYCPASGYAANLELAPALPPARSRPAPGGSLPERRATPGCRSVDEAAAALGLDSRQVLKSLVVRAAGGGLAMLCLCGNQELNLIKAGKLAGLTQPLEFADEEEIRGQLGAAPGSLGPVGFSGRIIVDATAERMGDFACGANTDGYHLINVNWDRDVPAYEVEDLRNAEDGDPSPDGCGELRLARGIEVGQVFMLGDKYSHAMGCTFQDDAGHLVPMQMGCYGIGVTRIIAAAIEQHHDERGILWPQAMAPFAVAIIALGAGRSEAVRTCAEQLYATLLQHGTEVLYDDRDERPGVMFADMELIGIPHLLVIGARSLAEGRIEYRCRRSGESIQVEAAAATDFIAGRLRAAMSGT